MRIGGFSFWSRTSAGGRTLVSYHPRTSPTWYWSVGIEKTRREPWSKNFCFAPTRSNQWHDYIRLPFGYDLIISRQDYHKARPHHS